MFNLRAKGDKRSTLEIEIESVLLKMKDYDPSSKEYSTMVANVEMLYKAGGHVKDKKPYISGETIAMIGGNLLGIGLILGKEKTDIIATKALGFVLKGRV